MTAPFNMEMNVPGVIEVSLQVGDIETVLGTLGREQAKRIWVIAKTTFEMIGEEVKRREEDKKIAEEIPKRAIERKALAENLELASAFQAGLP
jgi:hypothetical protein